MNNSFPEIDEPLDSNEINVIHQRAMEDRELRKLEANLRNIEMDKFNAHRLARVIVYVVAASYILYFIASPLATKYLGIKMEIPTEILSVLQAALFTLLGYLFGNKNAGEKSD